MASTGDDDHGERSTKFQILLDVAEMMLKMEMEMEMEKKRNSSTPVLKSEDTPLIFKKPRTKRNLVYEPIIWEKTPFLQKPKTKKPGSNLVLKKIMTPGASCSSNPAPQMPEQLMSKLVRMGATEMTYLMQKKLFKSDISVGLSRLSIPRSLVDGTNFLSKKEKKRVEKRGVLEVMVVDPMGVPRTFNFTQWNMGSNIYVLKKPWNHLVKDNNLCLNDTIQLWSFRRDSKLCFVLNVVRDDAAGKGVLPSSDISTTSDHNQED